VSRRRAERLYWSVNNRKLRKTRTVSFNLPAFRSADGFAVCPQAGGCATLCYARQGRFLMPDARRTREANLAVARTDLARFEELAIDDLTHRIKQRSIRLHDSGDFFSQAYLDCWFRIIARFPDRAWYCYTKSLHLDWSRKPAHFTVIQSVGGKLDHQIDHSKPHSRIFASHADRRRAKYIDGNKNDKPAQQGKGRIGLVYHGSSPLKPANVIWLRKTA
jgi:hypothetical protein